MSTELDAASVTRYLHDHPEVLAELQLPSAHGNGAISLTERQMQTMREKARLLEGKLAELIRFGEDNDAISDKVHQLAVGLLRASSFAAVVDAVHGHLAGTFTIPHVALRLWDVPAIGDGAEFAPVSDLARAQVSALLHPYCGASGGQEAVAWLGETGHRVRSLALIPLQLDGRRIGALLLASEEPHRFYAEMGTLFLERIGEIVTAAVLRTLA